MGEIFAARYELIDTIGAGAMGTVWRVRDLRTGRLVAAKSLRQADAGSLLRFLREQAVRVEHPHVLVPLSWAGEDERVLFTMPLVHGGSLATLVGDYGPLPPRFAAEILRQVLGALSAIHDARLIHRDLKPANILLDATGSGRPHAYVSDFGIALDLDGPRLTYAGTVNGTPGYLAPEVVGEGAVTPAVDLYAAGLVTGVMLTGLRPGEFSLSVPPPEGVPSSLWRLAGDLAAADPARRPSVEEALLRLGQRELAWRDGAAQEVEVFDQLPPLPEAAGHEPDAPETAGHEPDDAPARPAGTAAPTGRTVADLRPAAPPGAARPDREDARQAARPDREDARRAAPPDREDARSADTGAPIRASRSAPPLGARDVFYLGLFGALVVVGLLLVVFG